MYSELPEGHPIRTYLHEAELIQNLLEEIMKTNPQEDYQKFYNLFNHLSTVEKRFQRKENQLFPFLEQKGWTNPSQNMTYIEENLLRLLSVEYNILFARSLEILSDEDWIKMRQGEDEIGWMLPTPPPAYPSEEGYIHPSQDTTLRTDVVFDEKAQHFDEGYMTVEQVNLLLKTLPIDITFVDEHDKVIFYNRGEERVFPRSAGIIGREVKFCHPPKSVGTVLKIVEAFRNGTQNEANFWLNFRGRLIYVRYFAVRDAQKNYKGVIEMSQDITDIKTIEGERRLLEWE